MMALALTVLLANGAPAQQSSDSFPKDEKAARALIAGGKYFCKTVHGRMLDGRPCVGRIDLAPDRDGKLVDVVFKSVGGFSYQNLKLEWKKDYRDTRPASPRDPTAGALYGCVLFVEQTIDTKIGGKSAQGVLRVIWHGPARATVFINHPTIGEFSGLLALEKESKE